MKDSTIGFSLTAAGLMLVIVSFSAGEHLAATVLSALFGAVFFNAILYKVKGL